MKNLKIVFSTLLFVTLFSCVNSDDYNAPDLSGDCSILTATKTVQEVKATATTTAQQYVNDDIIEAYVTSSDEGGNFYKSISMVSVDGVQGFSMPVDDYNLYTKYEPGRKVYIKLKNKYFANTTNTASFDIGNLYNSTQIGRLSGVEYEEVIKRGCAKVDESVILNSLSITAAKNNANINKLIELDAVQFADESLGKTYYDATLNSLGGATNHIVKDAAGNSIIVRISEFANFAAKPVASGNGKIRGVLTKYGSDYQFMVRTEHDIQLTSPRVVPLFEETFTSNFPNWTKYSVTGAQVWTLDTTYGNPGSCAKMSGYSGGNLANEDWLISPAISLANISNATLTFDTATKFAGNALQIYISTNYNGTANPNTATWTQVNGTLSPSTGNYVWTASGPINISSFAGNTIYVAFKYTSTTTAAATWEVDNVKIIGQ
jgi:hypothetical protein|nr:DUF5689 domain-containing protein [uncultured Flavobacterium sp.]